MMEFDYEKVERSREKSRKGLRCQEKHSNKLRRRGPRYIRTRDILDRSKIEKENIDFPKEWLTPGQVLLSGQAPSDGNLRDVREGRDSSDEPSGLSKTIGRQGTIKVGIRIRCNPRDLDGPEWQV